MQQAADGSWVLRCPPEIEARIYAENVGGESWQHLPKITCPVLIMTGRETGRGDDYPARMAPLIAAAGKFDLLVLQGRTHFGWLEAPLPLASIALAYLQRHPE